MTASLAELEDAATLVRTVVPPTQHCEIRQFSGAAMRRMTNVMALSER